MLMLVRQSQLSVSGSSESKVISPTIETANTQILSAFY